MKDLKSLDTKRNDTPLKGQLLDITGTSSEDNTLICDDPFFCGIPTQPTTENKQQTSQLIDLTEETKND